MNAEAVVAVSRRGPTGTAAGADSDDARPCAFMTASAVLNDVDVVVRLPMPVDDVHHSDFTPAEVAVTVGRCRLHRLDEPSLQRCGP